MEMTMTIDMVRNTQKNMIMNTHKTIPMMKATTTVNQETNKRYQTKKNQIKKLNFSFFN
jgi:hypothetical protein